jgi:hypothetical protein
MPANAFQPKTPITSTSAELPLTDPGDRIQSGAEQGGVTMAGEIDSLLSRDTLEAKTSMLAGAIT